VVLLTKAEEISWVELGVIQIIRDTLRGTDTFFLIHLIFLSNLCLKISDLKEKNVTRGVGGQKSVTYYLNSPLDYVG
jgi:hypothetical protein